MVQNRYRRALFAKCPPERDMAADAAKSFKKNAPPPVMQPEEYRLLLEDLLTKGQAFGKTEPVAAYFARNIEFDKTDAAGNVVSSSVIEIVPTYIIMDTKYLTNEYARMLTAKDIMAQYAMRVLGLQDVNHPDYKGSSIWAAKPSAFEGDYTRRKELNEYGKPSNIWDPNPEAFRLTLPFNKAATIPTAWGTYPMNPGSTLAVRSKDIPALAEALQSIRSGKATTEEALYTTNDEGEALTKFDVYGMEPGFLKDNYKPVELEETTRATLDRFARRRTKTTPSLRP